MTFGQNIRKLRKELGLSLKTLSRLSGVSLSMISQIERDEKNPTLNAAVSIARALKTSLSALTDERQNINLIVMRKEQRKSYYDPASSINVELISSILPRSNIEIISMELMAGASTNRLPPHGKGVTEYIFVQKGTVRIMIDSREYDLAEGDYIYYEASRAYQLSNLSNDISVIFVIVDRSGNIAT